ncbi:MAG: hypothetical protein WBA57_00955 [Elainellaceae cyanobacterium]
MPIPDDEHPHLFIALTGARSYQEETIAIVNLTTLGSSRGNDTTVILDSKDHAFINRMTVVNYKDAFIAQTRSIKNAVLIGEASFRDDFCSELLGRIQQGALKSRFTPPRVKKMVLRHIT